MTNSNMRPPFNEETAKAKVKAAQDAWNTRNPELVAQAYTIDSKWRNFNSNGLTFCYMQIFKN